MVPKLRVPYFSNGTIQANQATLAISHLRLNEQSHNLTIHSAVVSSINRVLLFVKAKTLVNVHVLCRLLSDSNKFLKIGGEPLVTVTQMIELCNMLEHVRHKFELLPPSTWMRPFPTICTKINESCHSCECAMSHICMRHGTHVNGATK